ncbi:hypothetical protein L5515_012774 [Caenorhabditis briggsae]|uniref:Uncharacterized protein n=1 Tax=Caenorhabditis briggsae TaxID=6238 RepID=A0AAE9JIA7_CAEBR|nr:hypothetical protein L5515_012774 [Caenorhabditis briggsae]
MNRKQEEKKRKKSKIRSTEEPSVTTKKEEHVFVENFHNQSVETHSGPISDQNSFLIPTKKPMQPSTDMKKKKNTGCCGIL